MAFCCFFTAVCLMWHAADIPPVTVGDAGITSKSTPGGWYSLFELKAHSSGRARRRYHVEINARGVVQPIRAEGAFVGTRSVDIRRRVGVTNGEGLAC